MLVPFVLSNLTVHPRLLVCSEPERLRRLEKEKKTSYANMTD